MHTSLDSSFIRRGNPRDIEVSINQERAKDITNHPGHHRDCKCKEVHKIIRRHFLERESFPGNSVNVFRSIYVRWGIRVGEGTKGYKNWSPAHQDAFLAWLDLGRDEDNNIIELQKAQAAASSILQTSSQSEASERIEDSTNQNGVKDITNHPGHHPDCECEIAHKDIRRHFLDDEPFPGNSINVYRSIYVKWGRGVGEGTKGPKNWSPAHQDAFLSWLDLGRDEDNNIIELWKTQAAASSILQTFSQTEDPERIEDSTNQNRVRDITNHPGHHIHCHCRRVHEAIRGHFLDGKTFPGKSSHDYRSIYTRWAIKVGEGTKGLKNWTIKGPKNWSKNNKKEFFTWLDLEIDDKETIIDKRKTHTVTSSILRISSQREASERESSERDEIEWADEDHAAGSALMSLSTSSPCDSDDGATDSGFNELLEEALAPEAPRHSDGSSLRDEALALEAPRYSGGSVLTEEALAPEAPRHSYGSSLREEALASRAPRYSDGSVLTEEALAPEAPRHSYGSSLREEALASRAPRHSDGSGLTEEALAPEAPRHSYGSSLREEAITSGTPRHSDGSGLTEEVSTQRTASSITGMLHDRQFSVVSQEDYQNINCLSGMTQCAYGLIGNNEIPAEAKKTALQLLKEINFHLYKNDSSHREEVYAQTTPLIGRLEQDIFDEKQRKRHARSVANRRPRKKRNNR